MDEGNIVAIVALVVSLVALFVALFQFLQSSAITAEGWRQCSPASLGGWSIFRAWVWHWSEWRYEVFFTTPEILILDGSSVSFKSKEEIVRAKGANDEEKASNDGDTEDTVLSVFDPTCKIDYDEEGDLARQAYHVLGFNTLPAQVQEQWTIKSRKSTARKSTVVARMPKWLRGRRLFRDTDFSSTVDLTSWGRLIDKLYHYQLDTLHTNQLKSNPEPQVIHDQTFVAIQLRQESWDFLPAEVARPPARIRLGDLMLLAQRIGMVWRKIDISQQDYFAERNHGQQCVLYSSNIRSLGTVFHFEALSKRINYRPKQMLCSSNADKMYFGIIPGCKELGIDDIPTIGRKRDIDINALFKHQLSLGRSVTNARIEAPFWAQSINNDLLVLLAPFIPLEGSPIVRVINPVPSDAGPKGRHISFFEIWQVRAALFAKLSDSPDFGGKDDLLELFTALRTGGFRTLKAKRMDDVWCKRDSIYIEYAEQDMRDRDASRKARDDILEALSVLRAVHNATTDWFVKCQADIDARRGEKGDDDSFYMELVRAHFSMVAKGMIEFMKKGEPDATIDLDTLRSYGRPHAKHRAKATSMCEKWPGMIQASRGAFMDKLRRRAYSERDIPNEKVKLAWWYMMIRGIAWRLSVDIEMPEYSGSVHTLLPSDLYQDRSLVWLL